MATEEKEIQGESTEVQKVQTVTIEQFEEMKAQNEEAKQLLAELKKAQSGSDAMVTRLQKEKAQTEKEKAEENMSAKQLMEEIRKENKQNKLLAQAMKEYTIAGAELPDDEVILDMIRVDSDDPLRVVRAMIEREKRIAENGYADRKDKEAKSKGRKIEAPNMTTVEGMNYADMQALPLEEFNKLPPGLVIKAMEAALKQE